MTTTGSRTVPGGCACREVHPLWLRTLYASLPVTAVSVVHGGITTCTRSPWRIYCAPTPPSTRSGWVLAEAGFAPAC